jgi:hypothetical protein
VVVGRPPPYQRSDALAVHNSAVPSTSARRSLIAASRRSPFSGVPAAPLPMTPRRLRALRVCQRKTFLPTNASISGRSWSGPLASCRRERVRFEDDTTSNTAFLSGQTDLWATLNTIAQSVIKQNPAKNIELKFKLRNSPAHMAMRQGDYGLLQWLNTYVWLIRNNGELQRLHRTWLGEDMGELSAM